jgi:hypothetical protein|tara:strand:- start:119 stop:640 length:522 start_codon:yes stop_codon:yes gene_type:complete
MTLQTLIILAQFVAALGVISSVVYLAIQVRQNAKITKAQFGHSLTSRLYERYFLAAKDQEFSRFLAKNWSADELEDYEYWRITLWINTCLVDIFDTYDQYKYGLVDITHLNMRMNLLKAGLMKTRMGRPTWEFWKVNRTPEFIEWFETEIYGGPLTDTDPEESAWQDLNMKRD